METLAKTGGSRNDRRLHHLPWAGSEGHWPDLPIAWSLADLHRAPTRHEFQRGTRTASASALMKQTVEKLSQDDIIALAAYVGSLEP